MFGYQLIANEVVQQCSMETRDQYIRSHIVVAHQLLALFPFLCIERNPDSLKERSLDCSSLTAFVPVKVSFISSSIPTLKYLRIHTFTFLNVRSSVRMNRIPNAQKYFTKKCTRFN
jgi:hypothetical protein